MGKKMKGSTLALWVLLILMGCGTTTQDEQVNPYKGQGWYQEMEQIAINYRKDLHMEPGEKTDREVDKFLQAIQESGEASLTQPTAPDELDKIINESEEVGLFKRLAIQLDGVTLSKQTGPVVQQGEANGESQGQEHTGANEETHTQPETLSVIFLHGLAMDEVLMTEPEDIKEGLQELSAKTDRVLVYVVQDVAGFIPIYVVHSGHVYYHVLP